MATSGPPCMLAPVVRRWRVWRGWLWWTLRLVVLVPKLVVEGATGGGVGGGAGSLLLSLLALCRA